MPTNKTITGSSLDASKNPSASNKSACSPHKVTIACSLHGTEHAWIREQLVEASVWLAKQNQK
jgi:hypothetical protein